MTTWPFPPATLVPLAPSSLLGHQEPEVARKGNALTPALETGAENSLGDLVQQANDAAAFLKTLGHDGRLTILCHLRTGPKSVTELEMLLSSRQAVVSQQLARLRLEGLVSARREGQAIFYSILDPKVTEMLEVLCRLFAKPE